jgi:uncharacterized protein YpmB
MDDYTTIFIVLMIIIVVIIIEYLYNDCLPHKSCYVREGKIEKGDTKEGYIDNMRKILHSYHNYNSWRQALLAGLIAGIFVSYYLLCRVPTLLEWIVVAGIIFIVVFFSYSWMYVHYHSQMIKSVELGLNRLEETVYDVKE